PQRFDQPEIGDDANDDGRHALEDVGRKTYPVGQLAFSVLAEIDAGHDADGYSDDGGHQYDDDAADDGIGDPAAAFAHRFGNIDQEMPVDLRDTGADDIEQDGQQRNDDRKGEQVGEELEAIAFAKPVFDAFRLHSFNRW